MSKRVTIKDVARSAGVTHTTVSRVIHNDERISEVTRQRVLAALERMDYQPNRLARGLARQKTQVIALITPQLEPYTQPIVQSVAESCSRRDYALMLFPTNTWTREALSFEHVAQNWLVDGVIVYNVIYYPAVPDEVLALQSRKLPFVFVNKFLDSPLVNAVGVDQLQSVALAINHLAGLGHRRIGMLMGDLSSEDGMQRKTGFHAAMRAAGLPVDPSICAPAYWREEPAYQETRKLIARDDRPTAIYCANDLMAIGAVHAIRDAGLRVPQDVAVAGYDDLEAARYCAPPITTVRPNLFDVGARAVDLLLNIIQHNHRRPEQIPVASELISRGSTVA